MTKDLFLPRRITFKSLINLISRLFDNELKEYESIRFNTENIEYYETPAIVAMKIAEFNTLKQKGPETFKFKFDKNSAFIQYLSRMNYFYNYTKKPEISFNSYPANDRFLELTETTAKSANKDLSKLTSTFKKIIDDDLFFKTIQYSFGELHSNIIDHSCEKYGILMSQYFPQKKYLQLCLADNGIGIKKTLDEKFHVSNHSSAIIKALEKKVTSSIPGRAMYGEKRNAGLGLYFTKRICDKLDWEFQIISGSGSFYKKRYKGFSSKEYETFYFPGTLVCLKCFYSEFPLFDYTELMDKLRAEVVENNEDDMDWDNVF